MINPFNEIYTGLSTALGSEVSMSSVDTNTPASYPFVSVVEINNSVYEEGSDCCNIENFADYDLEINVWTTQPAKKKNNDDLCEIIDNYLSSIRLVRRTKMPLNIGDETTYRVVIRYSGIISKDHTIYRR